MKPFSVELTETEATTFRQELIESHENGDCVLTIFPLTLQLKAIHFSDYEGAQATQNRIRHNVIGTAEHLRPALALVAKIDRGIVASL